MDAVTTEQVFLQEPYFADTGKVDQSFVNADCIVFCVFKVCLRASLHFSSSLTVSPIGIYAMKNVPKLQSLEVKNLCSMAECYT